MENREHMDIWTRGRERGAERERKQERTRTVIDVDVRKEEEKTEEGGGGRSGEMKGSEVPEMKDARTVSPSSSTCDLFYHPATSPPPPPVRFNSKIRLGQRIRPRG